MKRSMRFFSFFTVVRGFCMKKIVFTSLTVFLLVCISSCSSQTENPSPTVNSLSVVVASFYNEEELSQLIQNPDESIIGEVEPIAYLQLSQLFPNDEIRYGCLDGYNRIYCSFYVPGYENRGISYHCQYDPAYKEMTLPDVMKDHNGFDPYPITVRTELITEVKQTLRCNTEEEANCQMFTISETPVMYSFVKGRIANICLTYKNFFLSFDCFDNDGVAIDLDIPSTSSFVNIIQNLTDPVKAEQELQRLKGIIDTHLETYAE